MRLRLVKCIGATLAGSVSLGTHAAPSSLGLNRDSCCWLPLRVSLPQVCPGGHVDGRAEGRALLLILLRLEERKEKPLSREAWWRARCVKASRTSSSRAL